MSKQHETNFTGSFSLSLVLSPWKVLPLFLIGSLTPFPSSNLRPSPHPPPLSLPHSLPCPPPPTQDGPRVSLSHLHPGLKVTPTTHALLCVVQCALCSVCFSKHSLLLQVWRMTIEFIFSSILPLFSMWRQLFSKPLQLFSKFPILPGFGARSLLRHTTAWLSPKRQND